MFHELEYKYNAEDIKLEEFQKLMLTLPIVRHIDVSSWDFYYTKDEDSFIRYRESACPELTRKVKVKDANNWVRVEVDLPLDPKRINKKTVDKFLELGGHKQNFQIYKTCFIYWLEYVNYVYYIVYDKNMKEQARFIEVEVNKDKVPAGMEEVTVKDHLDPSAAHLTKLGLSPQNRLKRSLFDIFRKKDEVC